MRFLLLQLCLLASCSIVQHSSASVACPLSGGPWQETETLCFKFTESNRKSLSGANTNCVGRTAGGIDVRLITVEDTEEVSAAFPDPMPTEQFRVNGKYDATDMVYKTIGDDTIDFTGNDLVDGNGLPFMMVAEDSRSLTLKPCSNTIHGDIKSFARRHFICVHDKVVS